jgi:hypothetical protein
MEPVMYSRCLIVTLIVMCVVPNLTGTNPALASVTFGTFDPSGSGEGYPSDSNGSLSDVPTLRAYRLNGSPIVLDGKLDDSAWAEAEAASGFRTWDPSRGDPPSEETVFKVAYDDRAVYVGVACLEKNPSNISCALCRRDRMEDSDQVSLYIDPYHDRTTAYNFRVNPHGSQEDRYIYNDGWMDRNWNAVWEAETTVDANGWYAEFRIPLSCIRYRHSEDMTWGFQLYRYMHGRGEDTAWVIWDQNANGFVSRFGELTSLRDIPPTRQLEITPYVVQSSTDPAALAVDDGFDHVQNLGADLKLGITPNLTLSATVQPDFGQVEADPAVLNLSPFETFYEEKRPFFIEGNQFFFHPDFPVFYSRRIGTGDENSRIRFAGKVTGKTAQGISVATLYAATDVTRPGQTHNLFKNGEKLTHFMIGRFGKEFGNGAHKINVMQTAVYKPNDRDLYDEEDTRDAWVSGFDFDFNFHDKMYNIHGSWVGSAIDPAPSQEDPALSHSRYYGTGGELDLRKLGGNWRGGIWGRWESDELELNDFGSLQAPDEVGGGSWIRYHHNAQSTDASLLKFQTEFEFGQLWLYGSGEGFAVDDSGTYTAERVWSYGEGHPQTAWIEWDAWSQWSNYWELWGGINWNPENTSKYETRDYEDRAGPLLRVPSRWYSWWGIATDRRRPVRMNFYGRAWWNDVGTWEMENTLEARWKATTAMTYTLAVGYSSMHHNAQHVENFARPGGGIGGIRYVFGKLDQRTVDLTLRSNILFTRDVSLEFYAQPYLSVGSYRDPRELARPDSYDFVAYRSDDFDIRDYDFRYSEVNLNTVLRWEFRPGSALFLVWKQGRCIDEDRAGVAETSRRFNNSLRVGSLFRTEPENVFMVKMSYWFSH